MADLPSDLALNPCPCCGADLEACVEAYGEEVYDAIRCPNGCDLWAHYA
mgnify:CR=1 FL=1